MKTLSILTTFIFGTFLSFTVNESAKSQTNDYCYLVTNSGRHINLSSFCRPSGKKRIKTKSAQLESVEDSPKILPPKKSHYGHPMKRYFHR